MNPASHIVFESLLFARDPLRNVHVKVAIDKVNNFITGIKIQIYRDIHR